MCRIVRIYIIWYSILDCLLVPLIVIMDIQSNLKSSNTDGSYLWLIRTRFFFSPYEILPIAQENKYLGKFSQFIMKLFVVSSH